MPLHRPEEQGQLTLLRVQVLRWHWLVPPRTSGTLERGRRRQIGHLLQQRLLVPRVLRLSEPPDVGDVLLLGHVLGVIQLQGAEQPPLQSLPEIIWPCRHRCALVRLLRLLNGAHRISQCLAGVDTLTLQVLISQLGLESLQVDLPEGPGSLIGHLLCRQGLHALLERRQDCHLIVQHLIRDQLLVPLSGRGLLRGRFPVRQGLVQLFLLPNRPVHLGVVELEALSLSRDRCTLTLTSWRSRTFNASSSASMDRTASVFGGALPRIVPSTRLRSACAWVPPGEAAPRLPPSRCWIQVGLPSTMSRLYVTPSAWKGTNSLPGQTQH